MPKLSRDAYDAVIIGAGIGGLVCGCYLAKAGMKVLILEKHHKPGGYCTSFKRRSFTFDAAAHSFGGYRYGNIGKILEELGILRKISINRFNPSDTIVTPDYKVSFWSDLDRTIADFQAVFPDEGDNINTFFRFLMNPSLLSFARMRNWTFKMLLDKYFTNDKLKAILSFPLFGNGGLPPSLMSAFIGATLFSRSLLEGGYYPVGGMQALSNGLAERFKEFGGELMLSCHVKKITIKDNKVTGVLIEEGDFVPSKYVVSNCDARQTFLKLLDRSVMSSQFMNTITSMTPSLSMFILYLGVAQSIKTLPEHSNIWFLSQYDLEKVYLSAKKGDFRDIGRYLVHVSPDQNAVTAYLNVPFKSKHYWDTHRKDIAESFIHLIEKQTIPELSKEIIHSETATPHTLYRYTLNYRGAAYGWEAIPSQVAESDFRKPSFVQGLYLTGHWTTQGLGIPGVFYSAYDTSKFMLRKSHF